MTQVFTSFLITSCVGTILAGIYAAFRPVTRKFFSCGWHYYIWLSVLAIMLIPIRITTVNTALNESEPVEISAAALTPSASNNSTATAIDTPQPMQAAQEQKEVRLSAVKDYLPVFSFVWLSIAVAIFLWKIISYAAFLYRIKKLSSPIPCPDISAYTKRKLKVRESERICSPLLTGIIFPTLILPKAELFDAQLHNILAHETTHLNRNDILYKWLVCIAKAIHWFNPAIYIISRQIDTDCEISCDSAVVNNMTSEEKISYAETILSLLSYKNSKSIALTTGMTGNKKLLKKRFTMIKNKAKISKKATFISVITAILIVCAAIFSSGKLSGILITDIVTDKPASSDFNLLFVGVDDSERADTILLVKCRESSIYGLFIPRDTLIKDRRISDIWASGGTQALIDTVKATLSVPVHYFAEMNLSAVPKIINLLGDVDFYVPMDMEYDDPHQDLHINLKEGYFSLNGDSVRQLLQFRPGNSTHGDLSRIYIHEQFIKSFLKQKLTAENLSKAPELYKLISESVKTNYPAKSLKNNTALLTAVSGNNIIFETIDGTCTTYNGIPVYELSDKISIVWPTESTSVSNGFGKRIHPITGEVKEHNGVDIIADEGSPVFSATSGYVTEAGYDNTNGNYIIIENEDNVRVYYKHLSEILVSKEDNIEQKDIIGKVGKTGNATGAHLHFEIMANGEYYNPETFLASYTDYHSNIDHTIPTSVINGFFKAFESGDYGTMAKYCTYPCESKYFIKNDYGNVFNVFGMSMAKLRSVSEPTYLKGNKFISYTVNVSCKTPKSFSILQSKNTFKVFLEQQKDENYRICDISY